MKRILIVSFTLIITLNLFAQSPEKISYQAIIRNSNNLVLKSKLIVAKISLLQGNPLGSEVYSESQTALTNANGILNIEIGTGKIISGNFSEIEWANGPYFIKTETAPSDGTDFSMITTTQILVAPNSMYTKTLNSFNPGSFTHYLGEKYKDGVIFYLYKGKDGIEHGLIVALDESIAKWQTSGKLTNANRTEDGSYNTKLMTDSPAAKYIISLGKDWYLPSIDELGLLFYNRYSVQKALRENGNTLLSQTTYYWSSTEYNEFNACNFYFYFRNGAANRTSKTKSFTVRAIKSF